MDLSEVVCRKIVLISFQGEECRSWKIFNGRGTSSLIWLSIVGLN